MFQWPNGWPALGSLFDVGEEWPAISSAALCQPLFESALRISDQIYGLLLLLALVTLNRRLSRKTRKEAELFLNRPKFLV